jgi:uncharacterized membrane protein YidH (DUF202 family)
MDEQLTQRQMEERKLMQRNPDLLGILLAKERTIESKLRTTLSVINTAVAIAAFGFALIGFLKQNNIAYIIGVFLLVCACIIALYAAKRFIRYQKESQSIAKHRANLAELIE